MNGKIQLACFGTLLLAALVSAIPAQSKESDLAFRQAAAVTAAVAAAAPSTGGFQGFMNTVIGYILWPYQKLGLIQAPGAGGASEKTAMIGAAEDVAKLGLAAATGNVGGALSSAVGLATNEAQAVEDVESARRHLNGTHHQHGLRAAGGNGKKNI